MTKPPVFSTLGCRLNAYETEAIREMTSGAGLGDTVVVNTCAVTAEAVRKARQEIRRLRRENPEAKLIVTGCAAQTEPETFASMHEVDRVIGNTEKMQPETWRNMAADFIGSTEKVQVDDIMSVTETAGHLIDGFGTRSRAYVQVQNGCDHRWMRLSDHPAHDVAEGKQTPLEENAPPRGRKEMWVRHLIDPQSLKTGAFLPQEICGISYRFQ